MSDLKNCPFCGSDAELVSIHANSWGKPIKAWVVKCRSCGAMGAFAEEKDRKYVRGEYKKNTEVEAISDAWSEAIEAWNRRVNDERPE